MHTSIQILHRTLLIATISYSSQAMSDYPALLEDCGGHTDYGLSKKSSSQNKHTPAPPSAGVTEAQANSDKTNMAITAPPDDSNFENKHLP